jgi:hypothetical protein
MAAAAKVAVSKHYRKYRTYGRFWVVESGHGLGDSVTSVLGPKADNAGQIWCNAQRLCDKNLHLPGVASASGSA